MSIATKGFTIVEVMITVAVIAIIAGVTIVGWGSWQQSIANKQVQSDLKQAANAMENAKNFGNGYPLALPTTFKPGSGVTISYVNGTTSTYCIQAISTKDSSVAYHIDTSQGKEPIEGICMGSAPAAPNPSVAVATSTSLSVSWPAVSGATSYSVKYGTSSPTTTAPGCTSSPCTIGSLSVGTLYYVNVTATNAAGSTVSPTVSGWTALQNPASYSISETRTSAPQFKQNVNITGSGGACSQGTTEWKFAVTTGSPGTALANASWQTSNTTTIQIPTNGIKPPSDYIDYARTRCNNGANTSIEGTGYASAGGAL